MTLSRLKAASILLTEVRTLNAGQGEAGPSFGLAELPTRFCARHLCGPE